MARPLQLQEPFMALDLPPEPEIDYLRLGVLTIAPAGLHILLGLGRDQEILGFRLTISGALQIDIAGADMPEGRFLPQPVQLICHHDRDRPLELSWAHKPTKRWTLP
jgi:hypothetical protein